MQIGKSWFEPEKLGLKRILAWLAAGTGLLQDVNISAESLINVAQMRRPGGILWTAQAPAKFRAGAGLAEFFR